MAEICLEAQQKQAALNIRASALGQNNNTQFILAEVQNTDYQCGMYQRFYIDKTAMNGDTAITVSRFIYFIFGDERVLSESTDAASIELARAAYFWQMEATPRAIPTRTVDGMVTMIPPTAAEVQTSGEYAALRATNPGGFLHIVQLHGSENFNALQTAALQFLQQHWPVQSVAVPYDDCTENS